jgi:phytoene dehydrogenase-like protein
VASERQRPIVIGAGINGLVAACYLAREGRAPLVLDRAGTLGGIASTAEFWPGFRASMVAPLAGPLTPRVLADIDLATHGLEWLHSPVRAFLPSADGRGVVLPAEPEECATEIARLSPADAARYRDTHAALDQAAGFFVRLLESTPPAVDDLSGKELFRAAMLGFRLRRLGKKNMLRVLRWLPMPAADLASEWFESEPLRAAVAARGVFAAMQGPRSPGTAARLLFQVAPWGDVFAPVAVPRGGMGALSEALAKAARAAGAQIRADVEVHRVVVKEGRAAGVALASGEEIAAPVVISTADPVRTLLGLVDASHLATSVLQRIRHYRIAGSVAIVHLALDSLPRFRGLPEATSGAAPKALAGRIQIGHSIDTIERAFDDAKYGRLSAEPYLEVTIPTVLDPALAPEGKHVLTAWLQFAPYALREENWQQRRDDVLDLTLRALENCAPGISSLVLGSRILTPVDLEDSFALTGGHVFQGDLAMDQMYSMRPIFGFCRYRAPVPGLYFCGSGTHPGIGVTGAEALNAAREVLADLRRNQK